MSGDQAPARSEFARRLARNSMHNAFGRGWMILVTLALTAYTVSRLGNESFALWAIMLAIINYASVLHVGGNAFAKFIAEYRSQGDGRKVSAVITNAVLLYLVGSLVMCALGSSLETKLGRLLNLPAGLAADFPFVFRVTLVTYACQQTANAFRSVVFGYQRLDLMRRLWMQTSLVQVVGAVVAIEFGYGVKGLAVSHAIYTCVAGVAAFVVAKRLADARIHPASVDWRLLRRMVGFGANLQVADIAKLLHMQADKLIIASSLGLGVTAFYELGQKAARGFRALPPMLTDVVMPAVSELDAREGGERIQKLYKRTFGIVLMVTVPCMALVVSGAEWIVAAWLGPGYGAAALCLQAMFVTYGMHALTGIGSAVLRGCGRPEFEARVRLAMALAHVTLTLLLVPVWGLRGTLVAMAVSGVAADFLFLRAIHRLLRYPARRAFVDLASKPLVSSLAAGAVAWMVTRGVGLGEGIDRWQAFQMLVLHATVFAVVFSAAALTTGAVGKAERELIKAVAPRLFARRTTPEPPAAADSVDKAA